MQQLHKWATNALNKDDTIIASLDDYLNSLDPLTTELKITKNILDINNKQITELPNWLSHRFRNIKKLTISGHLITSIPEDLLHMRLEYINLSHNKLTDFPIFEFTNKITEINYSHNEISTLPEDYNYMFPAIRTFNLSYNRIENIPNNLFATHQEVWGDKVLNMQFLNNLDLNNNKIKIIPPAFKIFAKLNYKINVNLSYNRIKTIPIIILTPQPQTIEKVILEYYNKLNHNLLIDVMDEIQFCTEHGINPSGLFYRQAGNGNILPIYSHPQPYIIMTDIPLQLNISNNPLLYHLPPQIDLQDIKNNDECYHEFNLAQQKLTTTRYIDNDAALKDVNVLFNDKIKPTSSAMINVVTNRDIANNVYDFLREPSLAEKKAKKGGTTPRRTRTKKRSWSQIAPGRHERTLQLRRCGRRCFLGKGTSFPICARGTCRRSKKGIHAAYVRASQYHRRKIAKRARNLLGYKL